MIEEEDKQEELLPDILLQAQEQEDDPVEHLAILVPQNQAHIEVFDDDEMSADPESEEVDLLMQTAQDHDEEDEVKRVQASLFMPVSSKPASRVLFAKAKPKGARIVFADE